MTQPNNIFFTSADHVLIYIYIYMYIDFKNHFTGVNLIVVLNTCNINFSFLFSAVIQKSLENSQ